MSGRVLYILLAVGIITLGVGLALAWPYSLRIAAENEGQINMVNIAGVICGFSSSSYWHLRSPKCTAEYAFSGECSSFYSPLGSFSFIGCDIDSFDGEKKNRRMA